jgi:hypothetical protein
MPRTSRRATLWHRVAAARRAASMANCLVWAWESAEADATDFFAVVEAMGHLQQDGRTCGKVYAAVGEFGAVRFESGPALAL